MRHRRIPLSAGIVGLTLVVGGAAVAWFLTDPITPTSAARINAGTSLGAVNGLLGRKGRPAAEPLAGAAGENHYVWEGSLGRDPRRLPPAST